MSEAIAETLDRPVDEVAPVVHEVLGRLRLVDEDPDGRDMVPLRRVREHDGYAVGGRGEAVSGA